MEINGSESLECPDCNQAYLHQIKAEVTWRQSEDRGGTKYTSKKGGHSIELVESSEIYGRRDSLEIFFECECCLPDEDLKRLRINQHKGSTYLEWVK